MNFERPESRRPAIPVVAVVLALVGVGAAVAIFAFSRGGVRAKSSECKAQLQAFDRMFSEYYLSHDLSFPPEAALAASHAVRPEASGHYLYRFAPTGPLAAGVSPGSDDVGYAADETLARMSNAELEAAIPPELLAAVGIQDYPHRMCTGPGHCARKAVTVLCAGNLDNDSAIDVWSISTLERTVAAGPDIPGHTLFHHLDDAAPGDEAPKGLPFVQQALADAPVAPSAPENDVVERGPGDWTQYSGDGKVMLRQHSQGDKCELQCVGVDGSRVWEIVGRCIGNKTERRFVGPNCERTVVLVPSPDRASNKWGLAPVVRYYTRGILSKIQTGASLLPESQFRGSPSWLQGCYGVPGDEPRYSKDGLALEYTMINNQAVRVSLVETGEDLAADEPAVTEQSVLATPPRKLQKKKAKR